MPKLAAPDEIFWGSVSNSSGSGGAEGVWRLLGLTSRQRSKRWKTLVGGWA